LPRPITDIDKKLFCLYIIPRMSESLTVSDLVERANPGNEAERELWLRRVRYWSAQGVLKPIGEQHGGSGRHRRYDTEETYLAAVLLRLERPIGAVSAIADFIREALSGSARFIDAWAEAKRGADVHIGFSSVGDLPENTTANFTAWGASQGEISSTPPAGLVRLQMPRGAVAVKTYPSGDVTAPAFLTLYIFGAQISAGPLGTAPMTVMNLGAIFRNMKG
jgi:hypothetical protein